MSSCSQVHDKWHQSQLEPWSVPSRSQWSEEALESIHWTYSRTLVATVHNLVHPLSESLLHQGKCKDENGFKWDVCYLWKDLLDEVVTKNPMGEGMDANSFTQLKQMKFALDVMEGSLQNSDSLTSELAKGEQQLLDEMPERVKGVENSLDKEVTMQSNVQMFDELRVKESDKSQDVFIENVTCKIAYRIYEKDVKCHFLNILSYDHEKGVDASYLFDPGGYVVTMSHPATKWIDASCKHLEGIKRVGGELVKNEQRGERELLVRVMSDHCGRGCNLHEFFGAGKELYILISREFSSLSYYFLDHIAKIQVCWVLEIKFLQVYGEVFTGMMITVAESVNFGFKNRGLCEFLVLMDNKRHCTLTWLQECDVWVEVFELLEWFLELFVIGGDPFGELDKSKAEQMKDVPASEDNDSTEEDTMGRTLGRVRKGVHEDVFVKEKLKHEICGTHKKAASMHKKVDDIPSYLSFPSKLVYMLHKVTLHADKETGKVYGQMTLQPVNQEPLLESGLGPKCTMQPSGLFCNTLTTSDTSIPVTSQSLVEQITLCILEDKDLLKGREMSEPGNARRTFIVFLFKLGLLYYYQGFKDLIFNLLCKPRVISKNWSCILRIN